jgi:hypothetical protein
MTVNTNTNIINKTWKPRTTYVLYYRFIQQYLAYHMETFNYFITLWVNLTQKFIEKGLSSDVRQFLQYQQNKQSPLTSTPGKTHDIRRWKSRSWLREDTTRGGVKHIHVEIYWWTYHPCKLLLCYKDNQSINQSINHDRIISLRG